MQKSLFETEEDQTPPSSGVPLDAIVSKPLLLHGDCLELMKDIPDGSIDMICCDPPYGTVKGVGDGNVDHGMKGKTEWDEKIDHNKMLGECNRVLRKNGKMLLFSQEPYTCFLITNTIPNLAFNYRLAWVKDHFANSLIAKKAPVNYMEDILVFNKKQCYEAVHPLKNKILEVYKRHKHEDVLEAFATSGRFSSDASIKFHCSIKMGYGKGMVFELMVEELFDHIAKTIEIPYDYGYLVTVDKQHKAKYASVFNLPDGKKYKSNVLEYKKDYTGMHPTQKPVALIEDLVATYTNHGDTVLDFTMGSGTTGVACKNLDRNFIGIELDEKYYQVATKRIEAC